MPDFTTASLNRLNKKAIKKAVLETRQLFPYQ